MPGPFYYLAETDKGARELFSDREEARRWLEYQTRFHHPGQDTRWVDGGDHGWQALRLPDKHSAGHVYSLWLDKTVPDPHMYDYG